MKAVRQFSIVLIFSLQPAVTAHLINTSVLAQLSTELPARYLKTAMQAMVTMETVVEREMPTALRTK